MQEIALYASPVIAFLALVVAVLAWRTSSRSADNAGRAADASERSAGASEQSAATSAGSLALAQAEADRRAADRHGDGGPAIVRVSGSLSERTARVTLRVVGGPGKVVLDVEPGTTWCPTISAHENSDGGTSIRYPPRHDGETFDLIGHLSLTPWEGYTEIALPLEITVLSCDGSDRTWRRSIAPMLDRPG